MKKFFILFPILTLLVAGCSLIQKPVVDNSASNQFVSLSQEQDDNLNSQVQDLKKQNSEPVKEDEAIKTDSANQNSSETMQVKVYFAKKSFSGCSSDIKESDLNYLYRSIPKTQAVARASIEELLKGPTQEESDKGYTSDIPDGTYIKSITITDGEALVDFNGTIENGVTSCAGGMRIWQIRQTLLQFPTINTVKFSVDGRTEDIFQS